MMLVSIGNDSGYLKRRFGDTMLAFIWMFFV